VEIEGRRLTTESVAQRIGLGLALVPEDRQRDGLVQTMSVGENSSLASLLSYAKGLWVSKKAERAAVDRGIRDVKVKTSSPDASITSLSGGNQQKVVIGKVLMTTPHVILLDEPSRGIDVGAKAEIFSLMAREAKRGLAVLFATSEVSEALTVSNRIVVMSKGRIVRVLDSAGATRDDLMFASGEATEEELSGSDHS
jgi:erythritol transport system ATP-binding protein